MSQTYQFASGQRVPANQYCSKTKRRVLRITVWSLTGLLVLAFCPGPVEGNWILQPDSARMVCGCDSHNFDRLNHGAAFSVHGNHPPPSYIGPYTNGPFGTYTISFQARGYENKLSGFATLLLRFEYAVWNGRVELVVYSRDFHPKARVALENQGGKLARWLGSSFSVVRNLDGQVVIMRSHSEEVPLEDVDALAAKFQKEKRRDVLIQSDLPTADLQPLISKLEAHGAEVRVVPQVVFR